MKFKARNKKENSICFDYSENLPEISIIMASFNEEKNIEKKILSTFNTNYPPDKIEFLIGSDNSIDKTNEIITQLSKKYKQIKFYPFQERNGKINIINQLKTKAKNNILILTDTKVFFKKDTIFHLVKHFKNQNIKIVGGILLNNKKNKTDISLQEDAYMNREMIIKYYEGLIWGTSMGVFGAVYAIRKENLSDIPSNFRVDDFFVTMKVIEKKGKVIFEKKAEAEEKITGKYSEEFKRKVRIATGNFQNLVKFISFIKQPFTGKTFCFFSHKVLRWTGPFIILTAFISNLFLLNFIIYKISIIIFLITFLIPIFDFMLKKISININLFRYFTHFYGMNIALFVGFIKYIKGIKSAIWEPSKR